MIHGNFDFFCATGAAGNGADVGGAYACGSEAEVCCTAGTGGNGCEVCAAGGGGGGGGVHCGGGGGGGGSGFAMSAVFGALVGAPVGPVFRGSATVAG